jgi:hypothetical protein
MYGEKQEETEELKLDLQDIKNMYKAQVGQQRAQLCTLKGTSMGMTLP